MPEIKLDLSDEVMIALEKLAVLAERTPEEFLNSLVATTLLGAYNLYKQQIEDAEAQANLHNVNIDKEDD